MAKMWVVTYEEGAYEDYSMRVLGVADSAKAGKRIVMDTIMNANEDIEQINREMHAQAVQEKREGWEWPRDRSLITFGDWSDRGNDVWVLNTNTVTLFYSGGTYTVTPYEVVS